MSTGFVLIQVFSLRIHVGSNKIHVNKTRQYYDVKKDEEEEEEEEDNMRNTIIWPAVCVKCCFLFHIKTQFLRKQQIFVEVNVLKMKI